MVVIWVALNLQNQVRMYNKATFLDPVMTSIALFDKAGELIILLVLLISGVPL